MSRSLPEIENFHLEILVMTGGLIMPPELSVSHVEDLVAAWSAIIAVVSHPP